MQAITRQRKKNNDPRPAHIPAWLVIVCGLTAMLLFAFVTPMVVLRLQDESQLSVTTKGTRESFNADFMDVEQLELREKLRRVALAEENGEQLYTITTSAAFTRDEQLTFLQNVRERNAELIESIFGLILDKPLLEPYDTGLDEMVQYVVLDSNADYLFSVYFLSFQDYEGNDVQLLADRDDYTIYYAYFGGNFSLSGWESRLANEGYTPRGWTDLVLEENSLLSCVEDIYQTTSFINTGYEALDFGGFRYTSAEEVGLEGEQCRIYFSAVLEFYESYYDGGGRHTGYTLNYGFASVGSLINAAYGEALNEAEEYNLEPSAESY